MNLSRLITLLIIAFTCSWVVAEDIIEADEDSLERNLENPEPRIESFELSAQLPQPADCRFSGVFTQQKKINGLDQTLQSEGLFFHDCGAGIVWKTLQPVSEALVNAEIR